MEENVQKLFNNNFSKALHYMHVPKRYYHTSLEQLYLNEDKLSDFLNMLCDNHYITYLDWKDQTDNVAWSLNHVVRKMGLTPELPEELRQDVLGCNQSAEYLVGKYEGDYIIYFWEMNTDGAYAGVLEKEAEEDFLQALNAALQVLPYHTNGLYKAYKIEVQSSLSEDELLVQQSAIYKSGIKITLISLLILIVFIYIGIKFSHSFFLYATVPFIFFLLGIFTIRSAICEKKKIKNGNKELEEPVTVKDPLEKRLQKLKAESKDARKVTLISALLFIVFLFLGIRTSFYELYIVAFFPLVALFYGGIALWSSTRNIKEMKKKK